MARCKNLECKDKFTPTYPFEKYCKKDECKASERSNKIQRVKAPRKRIKTSSQKRQKQQKTYRVVRDAYMGLNPTCGRCGKAATEVHHKAGRRGNRLTNVKYFMKACTPCHKYIHANPKESFQKGWLITQK